METIKSALQDKTAAGLYILTTPITPETLQNLATEAGYSFSYLQGHDVASEAAFMDKIKEAAQFPDYFGKTDESLQDCLHDMDHWHPRKKGYVLLYEDFQNLAAGDEEAFEMVIEMFQDGIQFWRERGKKPFYIFLKGDTTFLPTAPTL
jgi:hypothetical protein